METMELQTGELLTATEVRPMVVSSVVTIDDIIKAGEFICSNGLLGFTAGEELQASLAYQDAMLAGRSLMEMQSDELNWPVFRGDAPADDDHIAKLHEAAAEQQQAGAVASGAGVPSVDAGQPAAAEQQAGAVAAASDVPSANAGQPAAEQQQAGAIAGGSGGDVVVDVSVGAAAGDPLDVLDDPTGGTGTMQVATPEALADLLAATIPMAPPTATEDAIKKSYCAKATAKNGGVVVTWENLSAEFVAESRAKVKRAAEQRAAG